MREDEFLMEVHRLAIELELLIDQYDLRELELNTLIDFARETWKENKDIDKGLDFGDLFDGLGISLN